MAASEEFERIHCNKCGQETKHINLFEKSVSGSKLVAPESEIYWTTICDVLECRGCEEIALRRRFYFSEWGYGEHETAYYPPRIARPLPKWKNELSGSIVGLLEEVYTALQADSRRLAMMGARALIDMVMVEKIGDVGNFPEKLAALEKDGFLNTKNRETLEAALEVGNAASHRGYRPKSKHVQVVMDIVENLLHSTILQSVTEELSKTTPKRGSSKAE